MRKCHNTCVFNPSYDQILGQLMKSIVSSSRESLHWQCATTWEKLVYVPVFLTEALGWLLSSSGTDFRGICTYLMDMLEKTSYHRLKNVTSISICRMSWSLEAVIIVPTYIYWRADVQPFFHLCCFSYWVLHFLLCCMSFPAEFLCICIMTRIRTCVVHWCL